MGDRGWDDWITSLTQWTQDWANFGRQWRTERTSMLQSMGSQRVRHDFMTKQQQTLSKVPVWWLLEEVPSVEKFKAPGYESSSESSNAHRWPLAEMDCPTGFCWTRTVQIWGGHTRMVVSQKSGSISSHQPQLSSSLTDMQVQGCLTCLLKVGRNPKFLDFASMQTHAGRMSLWCDAPTTA